MQTYIHTDRRTDRHMKLCLQAFKDAGHALLQEPEVIQTDNAVDTFACMAQLHYTKYLHMSTQTTHKRPVSAGLQERQPCTFARGRCQPSTALEAERLLRD